DGMGEDGGELGVVAREQTARNEDGSARDRDGLVELKPSPVRRKGGGGGGVGRRLAAVEGEEAIFERLRAVGRELAADRVEARLGGRGGLQLGNDALADLRVPVRGVVIVVLLRERPGGSGQEEEA